MGVLSSFAGAMLLGSSLIVAVTSASSFLAYWRLSDLVGTARLIERGANVRREHIDGVAAAVAQSNSVVDAKFECLEDVSRSLVTLRLYLWERARSELDSQKAETLAHLANEAVTSRLRCSPLDGNAWFWKAKLHAALGDPLTSVRALQASYWLAPAERWIMVQRFGFVSPKVAAAPYMVVEREFETELQRLVRHLDAYEVAELYVGSGQDVRGRLAKSIALLSDVARKRVSTEIDRLGVTLRLPD